MEFPFVFDADAAVTLRNVGDGAEVATASEAGISLNNNASAYFLANKPPYRNMAAVVHVTAMDTGDADETYVFSLDVDSETGFGDSPVSGVAALPDISGAGTGWYVMLLDMNTIEKLDDNAAAIRITCTIAGTTPSITYGAWLHPVV